MANETNPKKQTENQQPPKRNRGAHAENSKQKTSFFKKQGKWLALGVALVCVVTIGIIVVQLVGMSAPAPVVTTPPPTQSPTPTPEPTPKTVLPKFADLYAQNNDLAGWLAIDGTVVDYPVMYTPSDGEFYLYRTFKKEDDRTKQGTLFIDQHCTVDPRSANLLIHGHNMKNGTMFATLLKYKQKSFYDAHPTFTYSTLYETGTYEIVSVFLSKVYLTTDKVFKFYQFYDAKTQAEFDSYITNIKALQLYDTGVSAQFGDELVSLATCEYSVANGRLVVVGRKVKDPAQ